MTGIKSVYGQFKAKMEKKAAIIEDSKEDKAFLSHLEKEYGTNQSGLDPKHLKSMIFKRVSENSDLKALKNLEMVMNLRSRFNSDWVKEID